MVSHLEISLVLARLALSSFSLRLVERVKCPPDVKQEAEPAEQAETMAQPGEKAEMNSNPPIDSDERTTSEQ